ncbi:MAG: NYN domain-containing protein [Parvibaculaceae bacterium]
MNTPTDRPIAVLIDAENVGQPKLMPNLLRKLSERGVVGLTRVYGNAQAVNKWITEASEFGLEAKPQNQSPARKNVSDFALIIDALDLMHSGKFGGFCIVSSDSDFLLLAKRLRAEGLAVYNCGEDKKTVESRKAYTAFFSVENLLKPAPQPVAKETAKVTKKPAALQAVKAPTTEVLKKFSAVVEAEGGRVQIISLVSLGHRLRRDFPAFRVKQYRHATLSKFLLAHNDLFECSMKDGKVVTHVKLR